MNASDLATLAANAGFNGSDVDTAVAIALAESSGNPGKYNPEPLARGGTPPGQGSYGLWQIYLKKHPRFAGWNLLDPQINANAAFDVYQTEGWRAWATYNSGRYADFLPAPAAAAPLTIDASTGQVIPDSTPTPPPSGLTPGEWGMLAAGAAVLYLVADSLAD